MNQEGNTRKEIVTSVDEIPTRPPFRSETKPGSVMRKMKEAYTELRLDEVIKRCPKEFLPVLADRLKDARFKYNANERELAMVADALVESQNAYINNEVKIPMTPDEAILEVRQFLAQQESEISH